MDVDNSHHILLTSVDKTSRKDGLAFGKADAMTLTEARKCAKEMFGRKRGDAAYEELFNHLGDNNVVVKPTGNGRQSIIGSEESVKKLFSTLREKEAADMRIKLAKMEAQ